MTSPPPPPPPSGTKLEAKAACTPGAPSARRTMSDPPRLGVVWLVGLTGQIEAHGHERRRIESGVRALQVEEAADEERIRSAGSTRGRPAPRRGRCAPRRAARRSSRWPPSRRLFCRRVARRLQRRDRSEQDAGADRDRHRVGERANVEAPVNEVGDAVGRDRAVEAVAVRLPAATTTPIGALRMPIITASVSSC